MFSLGECICNGSAASVFELRGRDDLVVKRISLGSMYDIDVNMSQVIHELIFATTQKKRIIQCHDMQYDDSPGNEAFYFVFPRGESLLGGLARMFGDDITAKQQFVVKECIHILYDLKSSGLAHFDIKKENTIILDGAITLIDGGRSVLTQTCDANYEDVCTSWYRPPEAFGKTYINKKGCYEVDVWSMGILMFVAIEGYQPYLSYDENEVHEHIMTRHLVFNKSSPLTESIIRRCLERDPEKRATLSELMSMSGVHIEPEFIPYDVMGRLVCQHKRDDDDRCYELALSVMNHYDAMARRVQPDTYTKLHGVWDMFFDRYSQVYDYYHLEKEEDNIFVLKYALATFFLVVFGLHNDYAEYYKCDMKIVFDILKVFGRVFFVVN